MDTRQFRGEKCEIEKKTVKVFDLRRVNVPYRKGLADRQRLHIEITLKI